MADTKEWTLMFYMASDNPLVISIVSQLKAIKAAGYHRDVNVIAQFDPYAEGTPTHIFDVNLINKLKNDQPKIGFDGDDSFARNLIEDKLWRHEQNRRGRPIREVLNEVMEKTHGVQYKAPLAPDLKVNGLNGDNGKSPDGQQSAARNESENGGAASPHHRPNREPSPFVSLQKFLDFCQHEYPAKHYMLFILGHGVVVGNDIFLYDEHAEEQSIKLSQMGTALREFRRKIDKQQATFELVSFNSCSVSSLEVAYELQDTANYLLASQGPTFVGSWAYREILIRIFKQVMEPEHNKDTRQLIRDIFEQCVHNSTDFLLAGYSHQLTLCDLNKVPDLNESMQQLSTALVRALSPNNPEQNDAASTFVILYSHWKSQSFFEEMYTDLYDFCFCIVDRCERIEDTGQLTPQLRDIRDACVRVMEILAKPDVQDPKRPGKIADKSTVITASEFIGPAYQYSRGLSVYFPWTRPSEDSQIMEEYQTSYRFHNDLKQRDQAPNTEPFSWFDFLEAYFKVTRRETKRDELIRLQQRQQRKGVVSSSREKGVIDQGFEHELQEDIGNLVYNGEGPLGGFALAKTDPWDKTGDDCKCPSIKNYPRDTRAGGQRRRQAQAMPVSDTLLGDFLAQSS